MAPCKDGNACKHSTTPTQTRAKNCGTNTTGSQLASEHLAGH